MKNLVDREQISVAAENGATMGFLILTKSDTHSLNLAVGILSAR